MTFNEKSMPVPRYRVDRGIENAFVFSDLRGLSSPGRDLEAYSREDFRIRGVNIAGPNFIDRKFVCCSVGSESMQEVFE